MWEEGRRSLTTPHPALQEVVVKKKQPAHDSTVARITD